MKRKEEQQFYNSSSTLTTIPFATQSNNTSSLLVPRSSTNLPTRLSRDPPPAALFRNPGGGQPPHRNAPPFPHPPHFHPSASPFPQSPAPNFKPPPPGGGGGAFQGGPPPDFGGGRGRGGGPFAGGPPHAAGGGRGGPPHAGVGGRGGPPPHMPPGGAGGGRGGPPPHAPHHQGKPPSKPSGNGDEEVIESEFVEIEDAFIERPRRVRPQPQPAAASKGGAKGGNGPEKKGGEEDDDDWPQKRYQPHERTALLHGRGNREEQERQRHKLIKVIYLIFFAFAALEAVLITSLSGWVIHMVSCIVYETCAPTSERLASFGLYFVILFLVFIMPYLLGAFAVAISSGRFLWFFSFLTALIDIVVIILLCVYVRWEVALGMVPQIVVAFFGFAMSSILSSESAERGPHAVHNRCCLFLCC